MWETTVGSAIAGEESFDAALREVKEVFVEELITFEYPPYGGTIPIIDPYDGCTIGCPYCFQRNDENWNKELIVIT